MVGIRVIFTPRNPSHNPTLENNTRSPRVRLSLSDHSLSFCSLAEYAIQAPVLPSGNPQPDHTTQLAVPGGPCGPLNNARCPGNQCCSASSYCGVTEEHCTTNCIQGWGTCRTDNGTNTPQPQPSPPVQAQEQQGGSKLTVNQWVGIASGILTGCVAIIAGAYAIWKWHHKRLLMKKVSKGSINLVEHDAGVSLHSTNCRNVGPKKERNSRECRAMMNNEVAECRVNNDKKGAGL